LNFIKNIERLFNEFFNPLFVFPEEFH